MNDWWSPQRLEELDRNYRMPELHPVLPVHPVKKLVTPRTPRREWPVGAFANWWSPQRIAGEFTAFWAKSSVFLDAYPQWANAPHGYSLIHSASAVSRQPSARRESPRMKQCVAVMSEADSPRQFEYFEYSRAHLPYPSHPMDTLRDSPAMRGARPLTGNFHVRRSFAARRHHHG